MKIAKLATVGLIAVSLTGCYAHGAGPREGAGTIIGAIAGGLVGSQFGSGSGRLIATGVGAVAGAALGQGVGRSLDQRDRQHLAARSLLQIRTRILPRISADRLHRWRTSTGIRNRLSPA